MKHAPDDEQSKPVAGVTFFSGEVILVFAVFFVLLSVLIVLIRLIFFNREEELDNQVFGYLLPYVSGRNTQIMQCFTVLGSHRFLVPAWLLAFAWCWFRIKNKWVFTRVVIIAVSNMLLMFGLKYFFNRSRPMIPLLKEVPGLSFPSGHAYMGLVFFGQIIYLVYYGVRNRWLKWMTIVLLVFIIFMIGLSRVYLRLHYSSDVVAGYCFGLLSLMLMFWLLKKAERYQVYRRKVKQHGWKPNG